MKMEFSVTPSVINLSPETQALFVTLQCLDAPVYLNAFHAGLLTLPNQIQKNPARHIFVSNGVSEDSLLKNGFIQDSHDRKTYHRAHAGKVLTVHRVIPKTNWMHDYMIQTQFYTCTSILADKDGNLYDATHEQGASHMGLMDASLGILRTLHDPIAALEHKPLLVLNSLDRLMKGYKACDTLDIALAYWQPADPQNFMQMKQSIYKRASQWMRQNRLKEYAELLQQYSLTEKILELPENHDSSMTLKHLEQHLTSIPTIHFISRPVSMTRARRNTQTHELGNPHR